MNNNDEIQKLTITDKFSGNSIYHNDEKLVRLLTIQKLNSSILEMKILLSIETKKVTNKLL